ncbi:hypothetical protein ACFE04_021201 [Oxalis oulophora]
MQFNIKTCENIGKSASAAIIPFLLCSIELLEYQVWSKRTQVLEAVLSYILCSTQEVFIVPPHIVFTMRPNPGNSSNRLHSASLIAIFNNWKRTSFCYQVRNIKAERKSGECTTYSGLLAHAGASRR